MKNRIIDFLRRPQVWGFALSVVIIAIISLAFFYPDNFQGNSLRQPDMQQGAANGHEAQVYQQETGEKALWTNSLFGGMPTFQISPSYSSNSLFNWINTVYGLGLPSPSNLLAMMMLGFLILLFALGLRWYYALIGAIAWGFSSYFVIIIGAGHIWKFVTLAYIPPTIAGFILLYRGRYITGAALTALFAMLQLNANHPQMSYYFGLLMAIIAICKLVYCIRRKQLRGWFTATAIALAAGALAIGANAPSLYNTYMYAKETKRSTSELTPLSTGDRESPSERPTGGMPKEQIVGWSYGRAETFTLFVPNIKGGASARPEGGHMVPVSLSDLDGAAELAANAPLLPYLSQYFNDSEGTNGPVYVGIIIAALFILGCFIIKGPLKWALLIGTVLSILLAWGRNAGWLTDFMIYNFPMYNKFRAVESILVIAEFTMPLLAILAFAKLVDTGREQLPQLRKPALIALGIPAAICVLALVAPGAFGEAVTQTDRNTSEAVQKQIVDYGRQAGASQEQIGQMLYAYSLSNPANMDAAKALRYGMVRSDALRSLLFLLLAAVFITFYLRGKGNRILVVGAVGLLVLIDLYGVDKRYVSHSSFGPADLPGGEIAFTPDAMDRAILADTSAHYRVLDIPGFNSAERSYFHKTLGGYHAAKLNRYEDLIQRKLGIVAQVGYFPDDPALDEPEYADLARQLRNGYRVADMLNARYIITGDTEAPLVKNNKALGNAWLVDSIIWVDNADEEMAALDIDKLDFSRQAVADRKFEGSLNSVSSIVPGDTVYLTSYSPDKLTYHVDTRNGGTAVFSEVYFPWGWHADIDGNEVPLARVNYLLRALSVPAGAHTISMSFCPRSITVSTNIAYACVTLVYMLLLAGIFVESRRCKLF